MIGERDDFRTALVRQLWHIASDIFVLSFIWWITKLSLVSFYVFWCREKRKKISKVDTKKNKLQLKM